MNNQDFRNFPDNKKSHILLPTLFLGLQPAHTGGVARRQLTVLLVLTQTARTNFQRDDGKGVIWSGIVSFVLSVVHNRRRDGGDEWIAAFSDQYPVNIVKVTGILISLRSMVVGNKIKLELDTLVIQLHPPSPPQLGFVRTMTKKKHAAKRGCPPRWWRLLLTTTAAARVNGMSFHWENFNFCQPVMSALNFSGSVVRVCRHNLHWGLLN